jgi:hypothetical protein
MYLKKGKQLTKFGRFCALAYQSKLPNYTNLKSEAEVITHPTIESHRGHNLTALQNLL